MRNIFLISHYELRKHFRNPLTYLIFVLTLVYLGAILYIPLFSTQIQYKQQVQFGVESFFSQLLLSLLFIVPIITMNIFSVNNQYQIKILFSSPISPAQVIVGKWLSLLFLFIILILSTSIYPITLNFISIPRIDIGIFICAYFGIVLILSLFTASGIASSVIFHNPIISYLVSILFLMILMSGTLFNQSRVAPIITTFKYINWYEQYSITFLKGIIHIYPVIYFLSVTIFFLALSTLLIKQRVWDNEKAK